MCLDQNTSNTRWICWVDPGEPAEVGGGMDEFKDDSEDHLIEFWVHGRRRPLYRSRRG